MSYDRTFFSLRRWPITCFGRCMNCLRPRGYDITHSWWINQQSFLPFAVTSHLFLPLWPWRIPWEQVSTVYQQGKSWSWDPDIGALISSPGELESLFWTFLVHKATTDSLLWNDVTSHPNTGHKDVVAWGLPKDLAAFYSLVPSHMPRTSYINFGTQYKVKMSRLLFLKSGGWEDKALTFPKLKMFSFCGLSLDWPWYSLFATWGHAPLDRESWTPHRLWGDLEQAQPLAASFPLPPA